MIGPQSVAIRSVGEWSFTSSRPYFSPFADVLVEGVFTGPDGRQLVMPAFYYGDGTWRLRFNPKLVGRWQVELRSRPHNPEFALQASFEATASDARGTLVAVPGEAWGYVYENGEPYLPFGDTVYDLFGMEYCGGDVQGFVARRKQQGFNLLRIRLTSSQFHPPAGDFEW